MTNFYFYKIIPVAVWIIAHGEERGSRQVETVVGEEATKAGHVSPG